MKSNNGISEIDVYYVSDSDYDMNGATSSEEITEYIPGKFVFASRSDSLGVVALAEDTAQMRPTTQIEEFYLDRAVSQTPSEYALRFVTEMYVSGPLSSVIEKIRL